MCDIFHQGADADGFPSCSLPCRTTASCFTLEVCQTNLVSSVISLSWAPRYRFPKCPLGQCPHYNSLALNVRLVLYVCFLQYGYVPEVGYVAIVAKERWHLHGAVDQTVASSGHQVSVNGGVRRRSRCNATAVMLLGGCDGISYFSTFRHCLCSDDYVETLLQCLIGDMACKFCIWRDLCQRVEGAAK